LKSAHAGNLSKAQRFAQFHGDGIMYLISQLSDLYFLVAEKFDGVGRMTTAAIKTLNAHDGGFSRHQTGGQARAPVI